MRTWADSTLMCMKKNDLIEHLRCAEHNQAVAEERLAQHIENVKDRVPVVRCKYCKYRRKNDENEPYCTAKDGLLHPSDDEFCSYGKRKEQTKE